MPSPTPIGALRRQLRAARRALPPVVQQAHARAAARRLQQLLSGYRPRRIALYLPADGELDPRALQARTNHPATRWFLPVLRGHARGRLWFVEWQPGEPLRANRYRIPEPKSRRRIRPAWQLDLILLPLVGFDAAGNRLGMGGGYYDRSLAFLTQRRHWHRPRLIGLAHECQRMEQLPQQPWDIPLDAVVTEAGIYLGKVLGARG